MLFLINYGVPHHHGYVFDFFFNNELKKMNKAKKVLCISGSLVITLSEFGTITDSFPITQSFDPLLI